MPLRGNCHINNPAGNSHATIRSYHAHVPGKMPSSRNALDVGGSQPLTHLAIAEIFCATRQNTLDVLVVH